MPESKSAAGAMGDIIGSTRQRIEHSEDPADRLKNLVAATPKPAPGTTPVQATTLPSTAAPPVVREPASATLPAGYFPQVSSEVGIIPKRKPQRGPARTLHISMRLSLPERDRLVRWCDDRNLSLPDGIMSLIDIAEGKGSTPE